MRGGAQCHLVEAADGNCYILKPRNNPQHRRVLSNEWLSSAFLRYLRLPVPETAMLDVTEDLLADYPDFAIQLGRSSHPVAPGWHFGSRFPGDPGTVAVFDYLPDSVLRGVANLADFAGALVFDKWVANADARQAIFFRANIRPNEDSAQPSAARPGFAALFIDHGFAFGGPHWTFQDAPLAGLSPARLVYEGVRGWPDFEPWLEWVTHFPEEVVDHAMRQLPETWLEGDYDELVRMCDKLMSRRKRVARLIEDCRGHRFNLFPNWR
jgi:hypothetical protein